ncbi:MAG: hypothetical protein PVF95_04245 [bacterium]
MRVRSLSVFALCCVLVACPAGAGLLNQHVKLGLHIELHEERGCSKNMPVLNDRQDFVNYWMSAEFPCDFDFFVVVFSFDETQGVEFALDWPGEWGSTWYTFVCADNNLGDIREPGDWISIVYNQCQPGNDGTGFLIPAWAWLTATGPGELEILPTPGDRISLIGCWHHDYEEIMVDSVFYAAIGFVPYMGPPLVATEPTTWGGIKAMFR